MYDHVRLLISDCHLSSILHRFRDRASRSRKPPHLSLSPRSRGPLWISPSNLPCYNLRLYATFVWKPRDPSFSRLVTIYSGYRQTDDILWQLQCSAKTGYNGTESYMLTRRAFAEAKSRMSLNDASSLSQSTCLLDTSAFSALEVLTTTALYKFTYLLTYSCISWRSRLSKLSMLMCFCDIVDLKWIVY